MRNGFDYVSSALPFLVFKAPKALLPAMSRSARFLKGALGSRANGNLDVLQALTNIALSGRGPATFRAVRKLLAGRHGAHYRKALPEIATAIYKNWRAGLRESGEKAAPIFAAISVTEKCNLKCHGCFARDLIGPKRLPEKVLVKRIEELIRIGTRLFVIIGGEPLSYPGLIEILRAQRDALFFVYTNATLMDEEVVASLRSAPNVLMMLSLEGPERLTDSRRGSGVFAKVLRAHRMLSDNEIMHGLSFTVTRDNIAIVSDEGFLAATFDARNLVMVQFLQLMSTGCADMLALAATGDEKAAHDERVRLLRATQDYAISNIPDDEIGIWGRCPAGGRGLLHLMPDGKVRSCVFSQEDVLDGTELSLKAMLDDERMRAIRCGHACSKSCGREVKRRDCDRDACDQKAA